MSNIDFFNQLARHSSNYLNTGRMFGFNFKVFKRTFNDIDYKIKFQPSDEVLDLGGGAGQLTRLIAQKCHHIVLADAAAEALKLARRNLTNRSNADFSLCDISQPLPFANEKFDKIICYSVVHYLNNYQEFQYLIKELLRISKPNAKILIADIPLQEKYDFDLLQRKSNFLKNFILNQKYYFKKFITQFFYRLKGADPSQVTGLSYTKKIITELLGDFKDLEHKFLEQDPSLPSANSREDLLIIKK